jgi:hypothetical protein
MRLAAYAMGAVKRNVCLISRSSRTQGAAMRNKRVGGMGILSGNGSITRDYIIVYRR